MVNEVSDEVAGFGFIEFPLKDPSITEVMVNGLDYVFAEQEGRIEIGRGCCEASRACPSVPQMFVEPPSSVLAMVSLQPISESNREAVEALRVSRAQEQFVSGVAESLLETADEPDGRALYWAVYADETPVGFVMISDEVGSPEYIPHYLWKLLIDERYQGRGFGTATLDLIVGYFRGRPGVQVLWTSAGQGNGSPIAFYERFGFEQTGEIVFDDEVLLRLKLG